jgi:hypothetical protein
LEKKEITKIFLSNKVSATLIIPIDIARRHGLEKPAHVIVEERPEEILIRRLEINDTSMQPAKVCGQSGYINTQ